ncbi:MAG: hypothetical protein NVS9B1_05220 [Candidatus Dormibacteraceae bacterium]
MGATAGDQLLDPVEGRLRIDRVDPDAEHAEGLHAGLNYHWPLLMTRVVVDLHAVDADRPDAAGEYALQLTGALLNLGVHAEFVILEPGWKGSYPSGDVLLLPAGGSPRPGYQSIAAVHDLSHLLGPRRRNPLAVARQSLATAWTARRSDRVLAPSETVADGLMRYLRVPTEAVTLVRPGLDEGFARASREAAEALRMELGLPERYLLAFGDKGLAKRAWADAAVPDGAGLVHEADLAVDRGRLARLLSGALGCLFAVPGAGNPIQALQAMACGSPPIVPGDAAFPEAVRDGGLTVRLQVAGDWSEAISALYRSRSLRAQLSSRGRQLAAELTAERAARTVLGLLQLGQRPDVDQRERPR